MLTLLASSLASPLGRAVALLAGALALASGIYFKGRMEGRAACQAEGERDVLDTISRAERARADADRRNIDAGRLRDDDTFRRD